MNPWNTKKATARRRWIEVALWSAGLSLLAAYAAARAWSSYASNEGIDAMREARAVHAAQSNTVRAVDPHNPSRRAVLARALPQRAIEPDMTAWSKARRSAYQAAQSHSLVPDAVLRIPSLRLEVPVYAGTSPEVLNRGAGWIEGTAAPGDHGNFGVAAHRDGFFRPLERIKLNDEIMIETVQDTQRYRVTAIRVVAPQEIEVLANTARPTMTLVTCYPFHFVGAAPKRFIVRAEIVQ